MPNPANKFLTLAQASEQTGVPRRTLMSHIHTGELTAHKLPGDTGTWLISPNDLDTYMASREAAS